MNNGEIKYSGYQKLKSVGSFVFRIVIEERNGYGNYEIFIQAALNDRSVMVIKWHKLDDGYIPAREKLSTKFVD